MEQGIGEEWLELLRMAVRTWHDNHPEDKRDEKVIVREVCTSLMDHFVESGIVKKANGKYVVPTILNDADIKAN